MRKIVIEQKTLSAPRGKQESNKEGKTLSKGEAGDTGTIGLHGFLWLSLVLSGKMLSIPVMKSYLLIW